MNKTIQKALNEINKHFDNLPVEKFEQNLNEAGIEIIKPASDSGHVMVAGDNVKNCKLRYWKFIRFWRGR